MRIMTLKYVAAATAIAGVAMASNWTGAEPAVAPQTEAAPRLAEHCTPTVIQEVADALDAGVTIAKVPNGPQFEGGTRFVAAKGKTPAFCQVTGSYVTNPATGKTANFIATFPADWNGKYLQLGCSGSCGVLLMNDPAMPAIAITAQGWPGQLLEKGYATFGNDLGHVANGPGIGWDWAFREDGSLSEDNLADYLYRADEVLADTGKALAAALYTRLSQSERSIERSYYSGCSQGGRGALVAASRFPEKFDGIVAGSPAADLPGLIVHPAGRAMLAAQEGAPKLSPAQEGLLRERVTAQCDALDGVEDGLIQNPFACAFNPETDLPVCRPGSEGEDCFTPEQTRLLGAFVSAAADSEGNAVAPGHSVSEISLSFDRAPSGGAAHDAVVRRFAMAPVGGEPLVWYSPAVTGKAGSTHVVADADAYRRLAAILRDGSVSAEDISRLVEANRKLLWYHNLSDEALTPVMSINRYKALAKLHGGYGELQKNIRLFSLPGTGHCGMSGVGPTNFDAIGALEAWVERGVAPNALFARKLDPATENVVMGTIDWDRVSPRTMPLCMFPEMAHYKGNGDVNNAASWECRADDTRMLGLGRSGKRAGVVE